MEINQLEQFRAIAECGTMSEAAKRLYLSQPTLSYNLKKLEGELGCQLFMRTHNQLRLTSYGEVLLEHASRLSETWGAMLAQIEDMKRREQATLHIGCFSTIASSFLMPHVAAELPESIFDVVNCATADLVSGLESGRFDVLIATDICRTKSFKWKRLYSEQAFLSAPLGVEVGGKAQAKGEDLACLRFNIESGLAGYSDWYAHILRNAGVPEESIEQVELKEHLRTKDILPECNLITSFIMDFVRTSEGRAVIPIEEGYARRNVGLLYRDDAPDKVAAFVAYVRQNAPHLFSGNAFIPFFMFPEDAKNLCVSND